MGKCNYTLVVLIILSLQPHKPAVEEHPPLAMVRYRMLDEL